MSAHSQTPSVGSESKWKWCSCTTTELRDVKCAECGKSVAYGYEQTLHYADSHWHLSCLLDNLAQGPWLADNPSSPLWGGAGFHP